MRFALFGLETHRLECRPTCWSSSRNESPDQKVTQVRRHRRLTSRWAQSKCQGGRDAFFVAMNARGRWCTPRGKSRVPSPLPRPPQDVPARTTMARAPNQLLMVQIGPNRLFRTRILVLPCGPYSERVPIRVAFALSAFVPPTRNHPVPCALPRLS